LIEKAIQQPTSLQRLVYVSLFSIAKFSTIPGRIFKPFNPLLGETYELVTPKYRALAE
jgi:hypothetical protein